MPQPRGRDLAKTREELEKWLRGKLPSAEALEIENLAGPSDTGFSSDTLLFDVQGRFGGEDRTLPLVARLEPRGFNVFPSYDVSLQYRIMKELAATPVPVPGVRWLEEDEAPLGVPFFVMDRVDGMVPNDNPPMHVQGWVAELRDEERERLWWSGIDALAAVHRLDWKALDFSFLYMPERGPDPLSQELHYYQEFFQWGMPKPDRYPRIQRAFAWLLENQPRNEPMGLCWGDSRLANMIFRDLECVAVIDWEMARLGNPLMDLAWWISCDRCFTEGLGVEPLSGFPSYAETVSRWCELTDRSATGLDYYRVLALMKFSVVMARIGIQLKHYELMPEDAAMDVDNLASLTLERVLDEVGD